ncbi:MAG: YqaA family protein [Flavobacteriales bacterium]
MDWLELGYLGLFLATFLAATVFPFSSEFVLAGMLVAGYDAKLCLMVATFGNWLGGMSSYYLGWLGNLNRIKKWLRTDEMSIDRWQSRIQRFGSWMALLCWTPLLGDVIAVALGVFRVNAFWVSVFMLVGKWTRYVVVIFITTQIY